MTSKRPAKKSAKKPKGAEKSAAKTTVAKIPQKHGGALLAGGMPGNAGGGRPPDEIRAKLRELGATKSLPLLARLLDGEVHVKLLGKCAECGFDQPITTEWVEVLMDQLKATTSDQLKASEQTMKYGLQAKELVIASDNAASFFDCIHAAAVELFGASGAESLKSRAVVLLEAKA